MLGRYLIVASLLLIASANAQEERVAESQRFYGVVPLPPKAQLEENNDCTSASGAVTDLRDVLFLRDPTIEPSMGFAARRIRVDRQTVFVGDPEAEGMNVFDIWPRISGDESLDVELTLGLLRNSVVIHWRETFQHRRYRQGLMQVIDDDLVGLCEGVSGITETH